MKAEGEGLREWRRKATDAVLVAAVLLHLPALILLFEGPRFPPYITGAVVASFLVVAGGALLRQVDHRIRAWALLAWLYLFAFLGVIAVPDGPYVRVLPVLAPMLALGLVGEPSAKVAMLCSTGLLISAPSLHSMPAVARLLAPDRGTPLPTSLGWLQGLGLTAAMFILMILAERFYAYLLNSLAAERRASTEWTAARQKLESEMEERRRLQHEIARIGDDERRALGQDIHDGVCQQLTGALLRCQALELRMSRGTPPSPGELRTLSSLLGDAIHEARGVAQGLCPLEPTPDALVPALRELAARSQEMSGVQCSFLSTGEVVIPHTASAQHLYRLAQEAVSNAVRHAGASCITIELRGTPDGLLLEVKDDGVGVPSSLRPGGMGLRTMAFRARILEGRFAVGRAPGGGTRVSCHVPRGAFAGAEQVNEAVQQGSAIWD